MAKIVVSIHGALVQEVVLLKERTTLGRHVQNDIVLDERTVSGKHAVITCVGDDYFLEDLGSTNGTTVGGKRIERVCLKDNDQIVLAQCKIQFFKGQQASGLVHVAPTPPAGASVLAVPQTAALGSIHVINGANAGKIVALHKPLTTLGRPGVLVVAISRGARSYQIAQIDGEGIGMLNGIGFGTQSRVLAHGDVIDLVGTLMRFELA